MTLAVAEALNPNTTPTPSQVVKDDGDAIAQSKGFMADVTVLSRLEHSPVLYRHMERFWIPEKTTGSFESSSFNPTTL